jgi:23S rRNA pseudouridine2605 synthase
MSKRQATARQPASVSRGGESSSRHPSKKAKPFAKKPQSASRLGGKTTPAKNPSAKARPAPAATSPRRACSTTAAAPIKQPKNHTPQPKTPVRGAAGSAVKEAGAIVNRMTGRGLLPLATGEIKKYKRPENSLGRAKKMPLRPLSADGKERANRLREIRAEAHHLKPVRLQKALAASGAGSRREMEAWIEAGLVSINGKIAHLGDHVAHDDKVIVKGHPIKLKWADRLPRILIYHKQEGEIVSRDDPNGRVTIFDRLPQAASSRWVAVGRLDINTSGLLILTTSGELVNRLTHPSFEVEREYSVRLLGDVTKEQRAQLMNGIPLDDGNAKFERIFASPNNKEESANRWYNVVIKEGRNREVRRMFAHFDITVSRLIRVRFGNMTLPPRLKRGQVYELNEMEVLDVMRYVGLSATGQKAR